MRRIFGIITLVALCIGATTTSAQSAAPQKKAETVKFDGPYYKARRAAHDIEGMQRGAIVFVGNSITEQGWWQMLIKGQKVENRGIGGDNTFGMLDRLPDILESEPRKLFLMAGINDLTADRSIDTIVYNIGQMIDMAKSMAPACKFYVQSVLPLNDSRMVYDGIRNKNGKVKELNARLVELCKDKGVEFIDLTPIFSDANGQLILRYTKDGIHIHPEAYVAWVDYLKGHKYLK